MKQLYTLDQLEKQEIGCIEKIILPEYDIKRLGEVGIRKGSQLCFIETTLFHDPLLFMIDDTLIAIRHQDAKNILIEKVSP